MAEEVNHFRLTDASRALRVHGMLHIAKALVASRNCFQLFCCMKFGVPPKGGEVPQKVGGGGGVIPQNKRYPNRSTPEQDSYKLPHFAAALIIHTPFSTLHRKLMILIA